MLLVAACPETSADALQRLSIGQRDAHLLTLREWTFGPQLSSLTMCPSCSERLQLTFQVADIRAKPEGEIAETYALSVAGYDVCFRLPDSRDLTAVAASDDFSATRRLLFERCLLTAQQHGDETDAALLPAHVVDAVVERMAQVDPQADVELSLSCPACGHAWQATFDIVSFFWSEIDAWAHRVLRDVHALASVYGWREADILALSPWRRQFYLEMVSQ